LIVKFVAGVEVPVVGQPAPAGSVIVTGTTPGAMTSAAVIGTEAVVAVLPGSTPRLTPLKLTTDRAQKPVPVNDNVKPGFPAVTAEGFSVLIVGCAKPALENSAPRIPPASRNCNIDRFKT